MNGWNLTYHLFDYNLDFFEVGAHRRPRVEDRRPAGCASPNGPSPRIGGLWGNHGYEAAYA